MARRANLTGLVLSIGIVAGLSSPAVGQGQQCALRAVVLDTLARKYGEVPVAMGVTAGGNLIEIFASEGGGDLDGNDYRSRPGRYLPHGIGAGLAGRHARAGGGA